MSVKKSSLKMSERVNKGRAGDIFEKKDARTCAPGKFMCGLFAPLKLTSDR